MIRTGGVYVHAYLRSIGFSELTERKEMNKIIRDVIENCDRRKIVSIGEHRLFVELSKEYGYDCGVTVCGEIDESEEFHVDYCYPFFNGSSVVNQEEIMVERHSDKLSFAGACDDYRVGITLIFYLLNAAEYLSEYEKGTLNDPRTSLTFSALARSGTILLPVNKKLTPAETEKALRQNNRLIAAAKSGDEDAMESLTMKDIDTYTSISNRIRRKEDVFTIVDSYFMPYGMECDQYSVMGEITEYDTTVNDRTGEKLHLLSIVCNDIPLDVCVNDRDLVGIPEVGRRFKGVVWLQGKINF